MTNMTQAQLAALIADVVGKVLSDQSAAPKATSPRFLPKGVKAAPSDLASKDARIAAAFARKGFKVTLKDRNDPNKPYDVRPFKAWLAEGRVVRRGQRGVMGLFHQSQTDAIAKPAPAKPTISAEQKALFARAKAALAKKKQGKPQPTA